MDRIVPPRVLPAVLPAGQSRRRLLRARRAANALIEVVSRSASAGRSVLHGVLGEAAVAPQAWAHYPDGDARDAVRGFRYFYHAHEGIRHGEHGHFHVFAELGRADAQRRPLTHLIAIAVDPQGLPVRAFTVNAWVTGERWQPAARVCRWLDRFVIETQPCLHEVDRWLAAVIGLFSPQLRALIEARDARLAMLSRSMPWPRLLEDRRRHELTRCPLSVPRQLRELDAALGTG